ncbi:MAG: hypothetical protein ACOYLO_07850 [Ferruginibacter sp.]
MRTTKQLFTLFLFASLLFFISCKKTDTISVTENLSTNSIVEKFFNSHRTADPTEKVLIDFLKRVNEKDKFVEQTAKQIGFPRWDKAITSLKKNKTQNSRNLVGDSVQTFYIPFVRDSANVVNATMIVTATSTDTSFRYICDWQYLDTISTGASSRAQSLLLMNLDRNVFGERLYKITDTVAFGKNAAQQYPRYIKLSNNNYSANNLMVAVTITYCYEYWYDSHQGQLIGCPPGPSCSDWSLGYTCDDYVFWAYVEDEGGVGGSGAGTGSGGAGNNGGSIPPNCNQQPVPFAKGLNNQSNVVNPCGGGGWIPLPIDDDPIPPQNPCAVAQNAAKKLDTLFTKCKADSILSTIPNLATETKEKGFPIYKKITISSTTPQDTTSTSYSSGTIQTGTDSSITISSTTNNLRFLAGLVHTHPDTGYSAHSSLDLYELIEETLSNNHFQGSFVAAANGDKYAVNVTDYAKAAVFLGTKNLYLDGAKWNETSVIGKTFRQAEKHFQAMYKGNPNHTNLAYEMAMAAVLNQFNTGITLSKKDATGNFKPIVVKTAPDPQKPKRIIYTQECL